MTLFLLGLAVGITATWLFARYVFAWVIEGVFKGRR
jgi:hypothetical protein